MAGDVVIRTQWCFAVAKRWATALHTVIAGTPASIPLFYLTLLSLISRRLPRGAGLRIQNSVCQLRWPDIQFGPRTVVVGGNIEISLTPHLGEFDQAALFTKRLDYETAVFAWLAVRVPREYDLVIEIGANVGVYSVFLEKLAQLPGSRLRNIVAFEPAAEPFRRLLDNLAANHATHVRGLCAAVGQQSGLQEFFEPEGHLTNGSLVRRFAALFSQSVSQSDIVVIAAAELENFLSRANKALIKIDVEGFEPTLIASLAPLLDRYRPDLLIEVLELTATDLQNLPALSRYRKFLVTDTGLREAGALFASPRCRDWVLLPQSTTPASEPAGAREREHNFPT